MKLTFNISGRRNQGLNGERCFDCDVPQVDARGRAQENNDLLNLHLFSPVRYDEDIVEGY